MPEVFSPEELRLMVKIRETEKQVTNYATWAKEEQEKIDEAVRLVKYHTEQKEVKVRSAEGYTAELILLREKLRNLLVPPTPVPVLKTLSETITEDCVDQLESRSKSETSSVSI